MKALKIIGLSLIGLFLLLTVIGFLLPSTSRCERSLEMNASPEVVFAQINTLKQWDNWSPWKEMDSKMVNQYNDIPAGVGAVMQWEGPESGKGKMTITESTPFSIIKTDLDFGDMGISKCEYLIAPTANGGSKVTWIMDSESGMNPFYRLMSALFKGMLEDQFDKGLKNLSNYTSKMPTSMPGILKGKIESVSETMQEAFDYLAINDTASVATIGLKMGESFGKIQEAIKNQKLEMTGAPFAMYYTDSQTHFELDIAIPVNKPGKAEGKIKPGKMKAGKTVVAVYRGPYENTWMGSEAVMSYLKTHPKLSPAGPMWEAYISDPELEKDTANWQTNVIFPVN